MRGKRGILQSFISTTTTVIFILRMSTSIPIGHLPIGGTIPLVGDSDGVIMIRGGAIPGTVVTITIAGTGLIMAGIIMTPIGPTGMVIIPIRHRKNGRLNGMTISAGLERASLHL